MNARVSNFKIGLFVLVGIVLLFAAVLVFGASRWFEGKTVEETYVAGNVDGLKVGAPVTLRGVPVGEISQINFTWNIYRVTEPRYVVVIFYVRNNVALAPPGKDFARLIQEEVRKGLRARIKSQGLAGASILSLEYVNPAEYPPLRVPWKPRHLYIPSAPGQFSEIIASLDKTMANLKQLDFQKLAAGLDRDLAAAERFLNNLDQANPRGVGENLNALLTDLRGVSARLRAFIGETRPGLQAANLAQISSNADQVLLQLKATAARLDQALANLDTSALNQTLENAQHASQELDEAVRRFKEYPSGALFGKPPPRAKSVQPPK